MKYWKYEASYGRDNVRDYIMHYRDFKDLDELMDDIESRVFWNNNVKDLEEVIIITKYKNKKYSYRAEISAHHASAEEIRKMYENNFRY